MDLSAALWSQLPFDNVERVLSFLPVPDLCRYCIVCKRWNRLISSPKFGALCAQNAAKRDSCFIGIRYQRICNSPEGSPVGSPVGSPGQSRGCCFLDLNTRRWYTVEDDDQEIRHKLNSVDVVGMGGGLVCQYLMTNGKGNSIVVYNPIAKSMKELPPAPDHSTSQEFPELDMIVDSSSQSFKVFLINHSFLGKMFLVDPEMSLEERSMVLNDPLVLVYDSTTNEWKSLTHPSCIECGVGHVSSVMFQGHLYFLLSSTDGKHPLWRYNLSEDAWENVAVHMPGILLYPQLMVSANRLYLAAWRLKRLVFQWNSMPRECRFEVSEIKIAGMAKETLFRMSNAKVMEVFDIKTESDISPMIASGFGNSLLFISKLSRKSMAFDLERRSWGQWPQFPLGHNSNEDYLLSGKPMNLILPNTPW